MNKGGQLDLVRLLHSAHALEDEAERRLNEIGLSWAKLAALKALYEAGEALPLTQLAERLSCVKSNITQLVDRLEADGLVVRKSAAGDRRTKLAALTPAGRRSYQEGARVHESTQKEVLDRLTKAEADQLSRLMTKLEKPGK
jgi:DNA-binding MarR family transcriptional regulator